MIKQAFRGYLPIGVQHDRIELGLRHIQQLDPQPAAMPYVGRPEEAIGLRLDHLLLDTVGRRAPDRQPAILVVIIEEHHEASFAPDEEGWAAVAEPPSIRFEDYPTEVGKREIRVSDAAARLANALHLHLD